MSSSQRTTLLVGIGIAGLVLGACGKQPPAAPTAPAAASTSAAATARAPAAAGTVTAPPAPASSTSVPAPAATAAAAPPPPPLMVTRLTLGNAVNAQHQVPHPSTRFAANDKTIYASVITMGSSSKAILTARWSYLRGEGELFSNISQPIATDGPATTTFEVRNPDRWPVGKYEVVILLDGKPVATQEFEITKR